MKTENGKKSVSVYDDRNTRFRKFYTYLRRYWQLYAMLALPIIYLIVFKYQPMKYILIAFKEYRLDVKNIWQMPWATTAGKIDIFKYFKKAMNVDFYNALRNTVTLNLLDLFFGFPAPIIFALILNELPFKRFKKTVQTVAYMPHFLSWVIIYSLSLQLFGTAGGLVNQFLEGAGHEAIPFLNDPNHWIATYIFMGVWQSFGWGSIIYLAAIAGINPELYEAAAVDGAGRFRKMWHVTLPGIKSTIIVLLIMNLGGIVGGAFDRIYAMQNPLVIDVAETIATFVYKNGVKMLRFSLSTAVGLFQSVVGLFFLLGANTLSRKLGERGIW
ncbi:MAG: ABC transporter permease subunit [Lachnospiraceae bacterium]|nr:ABC transporter permease subunit [Lachnospiraceae bacterium]